MAVQLQLRSGTATEHNTFTGANGEVTVDTTNKTLRVHDGSTVGGTILAALTGGLVPASQLPDATTSVKGIVILNNTLASTSTTQALTANMGNYLNDKFSNQSFGVGQTWGSYTTLRASDTIYTNTTGRPITVNIILNDRNDSSTMFVEVGGINIGYLSSSNQYGQAKTLSFIVPNGSIYKVIGTFDGWVELR